MLTNSLKKTMLRLVFSLLLISSLITTYLGYRKFTQAATAPDVSFTTITGKKIALKALYGNPVIVTFWATDCPACITEIPHLKELYHKYAQRGLHIIAVNRYYDPPNHVVYMAKAKQLPYDIALDLRNKLARAFGNIRLIPSTLLISPEGLIEMRVTGAFDQRDLSNRIENYLQG